MPYRKRNPSETADKLSDELLILLDLSVVSCQFYENWDEESNGEVGLPVHRIIFKFNGIRSYTTLNLTAMTKDELDALRRFFTMCLDEAEGTVVEMDKRAQEALDRGEDVYQRIYRRVPNYVVRKRKLGPHNPSLQSGPDGVPELTAGLEPASVSESGQQDQVVPDDQPADVESSDDKTEGIVFQSIWEAPRNESPGGIPDTEATETDTASDS